MLGGIAGQGGTDFQSKTPYQTGASLTSGTETNVVSISGKGILTSISQAITAGTNGNRDASIRIVIDGTDYGSNIFTKNWGTISSGTTNNMSPMMRFNTSLVVKHTGAGDITIRTVVSYLLD